MLGIRRVARGRADYYLADLARELPVPSASEYAPTERRPGSWAGGAAAGLALAGSVVPEQFETLLDGRHPVTGQPMGSGRTTVAAYDLTFSAPKSASVLFALGGDDVARRIVGVHAEAVAGAMAYMEGHGVTAVRRSGGEAAVVGTTGVAAGVFTHAVNRNLDPHLHSHVVMANLVHGSDGRWSACDGRGLWAHRAAGGAVYEAHLRAGLANELGVRWRPDEGRASEMVGMAPQLLGEFSSRAADIRRHAHEHGVRSAAGRHVAWATTRPDKGPGLSYREAASDWARRATIQPVELDAVLTPGLGRRNPDVVDEHRFAGVLSETPHGGAHRRDVVEAFGVGCSHGLRADDLERLTDASIASTTSAGSEDRGSLDRSELGVSERLYRRSAVVPGPHLLRTLGPRPTDPAAHGVWLDAARTIDQYRERWAVPRASEDAFGVRPSTSLASLPTDRLADHVRSVRRVDEALLRLGRRQEVRQNELGRDFGR